MAKIVGTIGPSPSPMLRCRSGEATQLCAEEGAALYLPSTWLVMSQNDRLNRMSVTVVNEAALQLILTRVAVRRGETRHKTLITCHFVVVCFSAANGGPQLHSGTPIPQRHLHQASQNYLGPVLHTEVAGAVGRVGAAGRGPGFASPANVESRQLGLRNSASLPGALTGSVLKSPHC